MESKLPDTGTTIFTVMSRLAEQHGALNLSQGFPEFEPPLALRLSAFAVFYALELRVSKFITSHFDPPVGQVSLEYAPRKWAGQGECQHDLDS